MTFFYKIYSRTIIFLVLLVTIESVNQWSNFKIGNKFFWWVCNFLLIFCLLKAKTHSHVNSKNYKTIYLYLAWVSICIFRGFFVASDYWDWKNLINTTFILLLPILVFVSQNKKLLGKIIGSWLKYALPTFLLFIFILDSEGYGRFLVPINFVMIFYPALTKKWKILALFISFFIVASDFTARSNVIKTIIPFLFVLIYYFKTFQNINFLKIIHLLLFISPIALTVMGLSNRFNVLKMNEYVSGSYTGTATIDGENVETSLTADTRTFLYKETISSAIKNNYILFGRTPARGYDSEHFGDYQKFELKTGKSERFTSEVSILNIFTWMGLVGAFMYMLVFYKASKLAIQNSNNIYIKIMGLYVGFRFLYAFIEDFTRFDLSNIFLWIMIGMCFSKQFRKMNNQEIRIWVWSIFYTPQLLSLNKSKYI